MDTTRVRLPARRASPGRVLARRVWSALALVALVWLLVMADRAGYTDTSDRVVSALDALYYATVSVTTTGYGDIVPVSGSARLVTTLLVTPLRVLFLILVVGTTVEVLTDRWREESRDERWRRTVNDHHLILGWGTKGRAAAATLRGQGVPPDRIVVIDTDPKVVEEAAADGLAGIVGDCTRDQVLTNAGLGRAAGVVVAVDRDDTAVLAVLSARDANASVRIVASAKQEENVRLLRRSGADVVVTADEATGQLLGVALVQPAQAELIEQLLTIGDGLELQECAADEAAGRPIVGVIRDGKLVREAERTATDRLIVLDRATL